jgi:hypothetical protein
MPLNKEEINTRTKTRISNDGNNTRIETRILNEKQIDKKIQNLQFGKSDSTRELKPEF